MFIMTSNGDLKEMFAQIPEGKCSRCKNDYCTVEKVIPCKGYVCQKSIQLKPVMAFIDLVGNYEKCRSYIGRYEKMYNLIGKLSHDFEEVDYKGLEDNMIINEK